jgi:hypothetical protein
MNLLEPREALLTACIIHRDDRACESLLTAKTIDVHVMGSKPVRELAIGYGYVTR